MGGEAQLIS